MAAGAVQWVVVIADGAEIIEMIKLQQDDPIKWGWFHWHAGRLHHYMKMLQVHHDLGWWLLYQVICPAYDLNSFKAQQGYKGGMKLTHKTAHWDAAGDHAGGRALAAIYRHEFGHVSELVTEEPVDGMITWVLNLATNGDQAL